jgi:predicted RND superfamily exporter protein
VKRFFASLLDSPANHPRATLLAAAIVTLAALVGAARLQVHASLEAMFPRHDPAAEALADVMNHFQTADELLVLVTLPPDDNRADPDRLTAYGDRFITTVAELPAAQLVESVIYRSQPDAEKFVQHVLAPNGLLYLDDTQLSAARQRLSLPGMREQLAHDEAMMSQPGPMAQAVSKAMMQDPLSLHDFLSSLLTASRPMTTYQNSDALIASDGHALLIRVIGRHPPEDLGYARALTDAITAAVDRAAPDGLRVGLAGSYPIAALSQRSIQRDAAEGIVSSILLLLAVFVIFYRRPIGMFHLAFAPVAIGVLWGFGAYGFTLATLSPIAAVIGGVLAGMATDYSVLYLTCYETLRFDGTESGDAARRTIRNIGSALTAAFVTSVAGFLAVGCSSIQAMRDFALLGTMGLGGSFLAVVFVLPALLVLTGWRGHRPGRPAFRFGMTGLMRWVAQHRMALYATGGLIALICIAAALTGPGVIRPDTDLTVLHPRPNSALDTEEEIGRRFGVSAGTLVIKIQAADDRSLLALSHEVQRRMSGATMKAAGIAGTYGIATWLPDPTIVAARRATFSADAANQVAGDFRSAVNDSPFDITAFTGYTLFLRSLMNPAQAPDIQTLREYPGLARDLLPTDQIGGDKEAVTVVFLTGSEESAADRDRAIDATHAALSGLAGVTLTGLPVIGHDADLAVRTELPRLLWIASALVAGYLLIHFRNPRDMLLSLLPAAFGLAALAGIARLSGIHLNMINLVSLPLLIGIDVDYGIYLVSLSRRTAADSGAHAVLVCATTIIAGYASLFLTSIPAVQSLGLIVAIGVGCCLAGAYFLLCPLLLRGNAS